MIQYLYLLFVYATLLSVNSFEANELSDNILFIGHAYGYPHFDDEKIYIHSAFWDKIGLPSYMIS